MATLEASGVSTPKQRLLVYIMILVQRMRMIEQDSVSTVAMDL